MASESIIPEKPVYRHPKSPRNLKLTGVGVLLDEERKWTWLDSTLKRECLSAEARLQRSFKPTEQKWTWGQSFSHAANILLWIQQTRLPCDAQYYRLRESHRHAVGLWTPSFKEGGSRDRDSLQVITGAIRSIAPLRYNLSQQHSWCFLLLLNRRCNCISNHSRRGLSKVQRQRRFLLSSVSLVAHLQRPRALQKNLLTTTACSLISTETLLFAVV